MRRKKICRSFLWGNEDGKRKILWIPWALVCKSADLGGLGLGFMGWKNKALLLKWAWRFGKEKDSLWRRVICVNYNLGQRHAVT